MKLPFFATLSAMAGISFFIGGCATPATPQGMVASPVMGDVHKSQSDLGIQVSGGSPTTAVGASQISSEGFEKALEISIGKAGLFSSVSGRTNSRYELNAFIGRVSQPVFGLSMTVTLEVGYALVDTSTHKTIWQKEISSEHTASVGDAFAGIVRLRLANEGAAAQNIESLLRELAQLKLE